MSLPFPPKRLACCLGCGREVYQIISYHTEGPLAGHPNRVGPMLTPERIDDPARQGVGVQVEFLMSDGAEADVAFCVDCAAALTPDDYQPAWEACVARGLLSYEVAGRPVQEMRRAMLPMAQLWPVAVTLWRKQIPELPRLVLARRPRPHG